MNATKAGKGTKARAAGQVTGTTRRLAGDAKQLQKKAEAALRKPESHESYEFGELTAEMLRMWLRGSKHPNYKGMLLDVHSILLSEFGEKALQGFRDQIAGKAPAADTATAGTAAPELNTERDGRLYAIALLDKMEDEITEGVKRGFSIWSARADEAENSDSQQYMIYRDGPQYGAFLAAHDDLRRYATREALQGFYVVMTDFVGGEIEQGGKAAGRYVEDETAGKLGLWGTVNYTHPNLALAALAAKKNGYRIGGQSEPEQPKATKRTAKAQEMAEEMMKECAPAIFALLDFGKHYAGNAINGMTAKESVCTLTGKVRRAIVNFRSAARNTKASAEINAAIIAIEDLEQFMFAAASEDAGGEPLDLSKRGQARCMFAFAMDAARAIERAQIAIGANPEVGFLEMSYTPSEYT